MRNFCIGLGVLISVCLNARGSDSTALERMEVFFAEAGIPITQGNRLTLLASGQAKFDDLLERIRGAKHHIHLEYFNFRNDSISDLVFATLGERARQGIEVRALFDAFGNTSNDSPLKNEKLDSLRSEGINIQKYDPITFPWVNHVWSRDHRKIVVIDGQVAYIGGMNIADYYIKGKPKIGPWHDMHCRVEGGAVVELQRIFARMWQKQTGESLEGEAYFPPPPRGQGTEAVAVVDRTPRKAPKILRQSYAHAIASADSIVRIVNPYFVPTPSITKALRSAVRRGVEVHIMVPEVSDIPFTPDAMLSKLRRLSKLGIRVHLYTAGFHHAKFMTVDGKLSTLGSMNLNSRSLRYDGETNIFILGQETTHKLDSIYQQDQQKTISLDDKYWQSRSTWRKAVGKFAELLTPFL